MSRKPLIFLLLACLTLQTGCFLSHDRASLPESSVQSVYEPEQSSSPEPESSESESEPESESSLSEPEQESVSERFTGDAAAALGEYLSQNGLYGRKLSLLPSGELLVSAFGADGAETLLRCDARGGISEDGTALTFDQTLALALGHIPVLIDPEKRELQTLGADGAPALTVNLPPLESVHPAELEQAAQRLTAVAPDGSRLAYFTGSEYHLRIERLDTGESEEVNTAVAELLSSDGILSAIPAGIECGGFEFRSLRFLNSRFLAAEFLVSGSAPAVSVYLFIDSVTGEVPHCEAGDYTFVYGGDRCFILTNLGMTGAYRTEGHAVISAETRDGALLLTHCGVEALYAVCSAGGDYLLILEPDSGDGRLHFSVLDAASMEPVRSFSADRTAGLQGYYDVTAALSSDGETAIVTGWNSGGQEILFFDLSLH